MKKLILLGTFFVIGSVIGFTQTTDELVNDGKNTDNVTTQSMGYDRKSYSPLKQINKSNVKRLVPIWSTSLMNDSGELAAPTVYNGVMYVINGKWTFAIDVETGPADLAHAGGDRPEHEARRADHARRGDDLQRQAVSRDDRQPPPRARHEDRQAGVEPEVRRLARGLLRDERADCRQRRRDFRHGRRRVHDARVPRRLGSGHRQEAVAALHDSRAGRARVGDVAEKQRRLESGRRPDVAIGLVRSAARPRLLGHRQRGAVRSAAARSAGQPVHVQRARDPARRPARSSAISSTRRTTCTTWTAPTSTCSPTSRSTARRAR